MASKIEIANLALTALGEARITSFGDNSKAARSVTAVYGTARDAVLSAHGWGFARKRVLLAADLNGPDWGYSNSFTRPVDDVRVYRVNGVSEFEVIGGKIHANTAGPLEYEYIARNDNAAEYSAPFVQAFAMRLAAEMAEELTQSNSKKEYVEMKYRDALKTAMRLDAVQDSTRAVYSSNWLAARR